MTGCANVHKMIIMDRSIGLNSGLVATCYHCFCWGAQLTGPAPLPVLGSPVGLRQGGRSLRTLVLSLRGTLTLARPAPRLQGVKTAICLRVGLGPQPTSSLAKITPPSSSLTLHGFSSPPEKPKLMEFNVKEYEKCTDDWSCTPPRPWKPCGSQARWTVSQDPCA